MKKILIIIMCQLFFIWNIWSTFANIWDIGHWKDSVWSQVPGTTFWWFNFNNEIRNDWIYTKPNDSTIEVTEAGDYLIIATTHDEDTSNGRYNPQLTISQTVGTWDIFSSHYTWFSRDNSENEAWTRWVWIVIGATANSQFQVQKRSDTDIITGWSVINSSDLQIVKLDQTNYWLYDIWGTGNLYWWTTPNTVDVTNISNESNIASIEWNTASDIITIKWDNKTYLVAWSVSFDSGTSRTQRIWHIEYDNTDSLSTRSYCYNRNASNEYCWIGSMDLIRTSTADIDIQTEIYIWDWILADQGWASIDWTLSTDGNGQMIIIEMPDSLEVFNSEDSVGLQDITTAQTLNIARDIEVNDASSFTKASDTTINIVNPSNIFTWANIWTARSNIASWARQTSYGSIVIDWIEQTIWRHGNYSRWNQWTQDTFAMWFHPAGIFTTSSAWSTLWINSTPLAWWEAGWNDRTQPWTLGFFVMNLDTLTPPAINPILWVTYSDNDADNIVKTNQVVKYNLDIQNTGTDATGITAVAQIDNNYGVPYWFTYVNCGSPSESFTAPNLNFSNISILSWNTCSLEYYVQVDSSAPDASIITNNIDVSNAVEGWNNPVLINWDNLTVQACWIVNDVNIEFVTDNWWFETFWSLTPNWNTCWVWEVANGWNTTQVNCTSWWTRVASTGNWYASNSTINEWPYSLTVWAQYDLHVVDDYWDWMTWSPDVVIQQNWSTSDTFVVDNNGWVFTFIVQNSPACADTTNPEVSINQTNSQTDPTILNNITYSVIFDEPINIWTFTAADINITWTTWTITSWPTEISPFNGTSFNFSVSWMTQFDTVTATISAWWIEDISWNTNNASTSFDNQVTYNWAPPSPGWVSTNLQIWLRSDIWTSTTTDGNTLNTWNDQSWNWYNATAWIAPIYLNNNTNNLNYNPIVDFNWTTQYLENVWNWAYTHSYFAVIVPDQDVNWSLAWQVPFWIDCNSWVLSSWTCWLTFAWLTLWAFTLAINDEVITHAIWSSTRWRSAQIWTASYPAWKPMLINMNENATWDGTEISEKWLVLDNYNANTYQTVSTANYRIWMSTDWWNPFRYDWKIAEIINFSSRVNNTDKNRIESYLSLKYGITLNNWTSDYIASDSSTTMWSNITAWAYTNDVFGIGRDDFSSLWQIKSRSINDDWVTTIEAIWEWTNLSPSFIDIDNFDFLTISNNDWSNVWSSVDAPTWHYILDRKWKSQESWDVWTINLEIDIANINFDIPNLSSWTNYYFVYDNDNDWSLSDETPQSMTDIWWNIWQISWVNLANNRIYSFSTLASSNNIPTDISISNNSVDENSAIWTNVWSLSTTDIDTWDSHTYTFVSWTWDDDNSQFTIVWNNLNINTSPDYEIKNTYSIRVQTDDWNWWQFQKQITININNIWEAINTIIDFEDLDDENRYTLTSWTWNRTTNNPNEWLYSLESVSWWANSQTCFEVTNTFNTVWTITFDYSVSSEAGNDFLRFYIDNVEQQFWSWNIAWNTYIKNDVTAWTHTYKWCYTKNWTVDWLTDTAYIDYITLDSSIADITAPNISWSNYSSWTLLPWWNHNIIINYSDWESWIDISSDNISLYKWDWVSVWWPDISASWFDLASKNITVTDATYPTNNLTSWKYRFDFQISDNSSNPSSYSSVFYIDEPEFTISVWESDIWNSPHSTNTFSSDLSITVKTIWAWFDVILNQWTDLTYWWLQIQDWNWVNGFWFENQPYTSTINLINIDEIITTQAPSINTDWNQNTYIYNIRFWINPEEEQAAWDYEWNVNFRIDFDY